MEGQIPDWVITFPWLCHHCQIPGTTPSNVGKIKGMAAPYYMCWANKELESPGGKNTSTVVVFLIWPLAVAESFQKVCWVH